MSNPLVWMGAAVAFAVLLVLWRLKPMLLGRVRAKDDLVTRMHRWNNHVAPLFRKTVADESLQVAKGAAFMDAATGSHKSMATWAMTPSVLPEVDYVIIARPDTADDEAPPQLLGAITLDALRELLPGSIQRQTMWGHVMWVTVWPPDAELDRLASSVTPIDAFRKRHGGG